MKNVVFWDVTPCVSNVSEELSASIIRVTRTAELGTTLAVTSNRRTLRNFVILCILVSSLYHFVQNCEVYWYTTITSL
jgi:hypothetical protein